MGLAGSGEPDQPNDPGFHNLIEPRPLVSQFLAHPPDGFEALDTGGAPAFVTEFDLTTTMEAQQRRRLASLPLWRRLERWLRLRTRFIGTTVSEYALLPERQSAAALVRDLLATAADFPLTIVKDIPTAAPLVGEAAAQYAQALTAACQDSGFILVEGQALAYVPIDFASTAEYLARMPRARRKDIKRKLRSENRLEVETVRTGSPPLDDHAFRAELYSLYLNVYRQSEIHFDLLSAKFFDSIFQDSSNGGLLFLYRAEDRLIGFNLCFDHNGRLLDKYVGFAYPQAREHNLYVVSWFRNLEYALANGLKCYVAGWTDPEIKRHLGASFTFTRHAVYFRSPWLRRLLKPFKRYFEADAQWQQQAR